MSAFAAWGLTILALAIITTVGEMLLPKGRLRNVIRSVFASVTALAIVAPLPKLFNGEKLDLFDNGEVETDGRYLEFIEDTKEEILLSAAYAALEEAGYSGAATIRLNLEGWEVKSAVINFSESGIMTDGEHINRKEIIRLIADCFGINEEAIMTYG